MNTLATSVAEKIKLSNETAKTPKTGRKSIKFWLLTAVPTTLAVTGCSYLLIRRRWHR